MEDRRPTTTGDPPPTGTRTASTGRPLPSRRRALTATVLGATALVGCSRSTTPAAGPEASSAPSASASPGSSAVPSGSSGSTNPDHTGPAPSASADRLDSWSLEEIVGQLVMVGTDADQPSPAATDAVSTHHVGSIFLAGRSQAGSQAVAGTVAALTDLVGTSTTGSTPMLVATDQEGGEVQVLSGPGFSAIPSARDQAGLEAEDLRAQALAWGQELAASGVTMNLAPVADLVDIATPGSNEPVGRWGRGYGGDAATVTAQATAFAEGMRAAGVVPTCKHFPGLGRVTANTDTAAGVTDTVTARTQDQAVSVFAGLIEAGAEVVMMSSAVYSLIDDTAPAVFSPVVVTEMLRGDLGFTGVVITDDLSAATQLQEWDPGQRAVQAVRAGCDLVLASADAAAAAPMAQALVAAAQSDPVLAARVEESALRVLALKDSLPGA